MEGPKTEGFPRDQVCLGLKPSTIPSESPPSAQNQYEQERLVRALHPSHFLHRVDIRSQPSDLVPMGPPSRHRHLHCVEHAAPEGPKYLGHLFQRSSSHLTHPKAGTGLRLTMLTHYPRRVHNSYPAFQAFQPTWDTDQKHRDAPPRHKSETGSECSHRGTPAPNKPRPLGYPPP